MEGLPKRRKVKTTFLQALFTEKEGDPEKNEPIA